MRRLAKAFTLVELLIVIAIISILAAITFPVISSTKSAAYKAVCSSNMHQVTLAINLYSDDYDETFMPTNTQPGVNATSRTDRTWVQLVLPYTKSLAIFSCPADYSVRPQPGAAFDKDLVPGDTDSRYYSLSMHSNFGLNYQYISPIVNSKGHLTPVPKQMAFIRSTSSTVLLVDSVWSRLADGSPYGGGNYVVTPPCRYFRSHDGNQIDSFAGGDATVAEVYTPTIGWDVDNAKSANVHGNAWGWHNGRMNVAMVDGSVKSMDTNQLTSGCNAQGEWRGSIYDINAYLWDNL